MAMYMVEAPHSPEECLQALDEIAADKSKILDKFHFGCEAGVHTGWAILEAGSESAARNMLPSSRRAKVRVTEVKKYNAKQIESFHKMKK